MEKVDVLLSVYNPNLEFLRKQLESIEDQTYENVEVLIFDDCIEQRCDRNIFSEVLKKTPFRILPYKETNLGYCKAFETLVRESNGEYIAFCDQDDIWLPCKLEKSIEILNQDSSLVACSDRMIIDEFDNITCDSVRQHSNKPYESWHSFDDICKYNLFICYAVGMVMVVDGAFVRSTVPFSEHTGHDKWALACASAEGKVSFIEEPLVKYRRHGENVSGTLKGINSKKDYMTERVLPHIGIVEDFEKRYPNHKDLEEVKKFAYARKNHTIKDLFRYRYLSPDVAKFEIALLFVPNFLFKALLNIVRRLNDKVIT